MITQAKLRFYAIPSGTSGDGGHGRSAGVELEAAQGPKYKGRPLDGIWATAPYLHNGSVANLDDLLKPAAQRASSFTVGNRSFDPVHGGFVTDAPGFPKFSVNAPG